MKTLSLLFALLIVSICGHSQILSEWEGHYIGNLCTEQINGTSIDYHMELIIDRVDDSTYTWVIIYGEDSLRQERNYILKHVRDNQYVIDEENSILLSCNLFKNRFVSVFEVNGNLIHVIYTFEKKKVRFELTSSGDKLNTGDTTIKGETTAEDEVIPLVISYQSTTLQKAVLKRIKRKK